MKSNRNQALAAIDRAIDGNRLTHALLIIGPNPLALRSAAYYVASRVLGREEDSVHSHPDFRILQARNRMCQISVDHTREMIRNIQHSPISGERKVALILDADRMNQESANAFLKTLEEPPSSTNIILTCSKPNALMETIVSRCMSFWFQEAEPPVSQPTWLRWKEEFCTWLGTLNRPPASKGEIARRLMALYGLIEGFQVCMSEVASEKWQIEKSRLPEGTTDEELVAVEVGMARAVRLKLLAEMESSLRDSWVAAIEAASSEAEASECSYKLEQSIHELEKLRGLLEVNLAESRMVEAFFLRLLRIGAQR